MGPRFESWWGDHNVEQSIRTIVKVAIAVSVAVGFFYVARSATLQAVVYALVIPLALAFPAWFYRRHRSHTFTHTFRAELELLILIGIGLSVLGENYLYRNLLNFDSFVHLVNGGLLTLLVVSLSHHRWLDGRLSAMRTVLLAGLLPAVLNEIYELTSDALLGTHLWGDAFKPLWLDTASDVVIQTLGAVLAIMILRQYLHRWIERWSKRVAW